MAFGNDGSIQLPELYFKAKCQNPECRVLLGGFHVPCQGGVIVFACHKCNKTSVFRNEAYQIRAVLAGPIVNDAVTPAGQSASSSAPTQRRR